MLLGRNKHTSDGAALPAKALGDTLSGAFAAAAGAYLSLADAHTFTSDMSAGKGYIALAAVIFGKWTAQGAAIGALLFGLFFAAQTQMQIGQLQLHAFGVEWTSPYLLDCIPYLLTLGALVTVVGNATAPAALSAEEASE